MIQVYTDGACSGNGYENSRGGWAWVAFEGADELSRASGGENNTTNNIMEMTAVVKAIEAFPDGCEILTDSAYIHNCKTQEWHKKWIQNGWVNAKKEPVKNRELWEKIIPAFESPNFVFTKVKGHATNERNNLVDKLAVAAKEKI